MQPMLLCTEHLGKEEKGEKWLFTTCPWTAGSSRQALCGLAFLFPLARHPHVTKVFWEDEDLEYQLFSRIGDES